MLTKSQIDKILQTKSISNLAVQKWYGSRSRSYLLDISNIDKPVSLGTVSRKIYDWCKLEWDENPPIWSVGINVGLFRFKMNRIDAVKVSDTTGDDSKVNDGKQK